MGLSEKKAVPDGGIGVARMGRTIQVKGEFKDAREFFAEDGEHYKVLFWGNRVEPGEF